MKNRPANGVRVTVWGTKAGGIIVSCPAMKSEDYGLYMVRLDKPVGYEIGDRTYYSHFIAIEARNIEVV